MLHFKLQIIMSGWYFIKTILLSLKIYIILILAFKKLFLKQTKKSFNNNLQNKLLQKTVQLFHLAYLYTYISMVIFTFSNQLMRNIYLCYYENLLVKLLYTYGK